MSAEHSEGGGMEMDIDFNIILTSILTVFLCALPLMLSEEEHH